MGKIAFIFPGQGAQYPGMGKDFYEQEPLAREVFDKASNITGLDLPAICFTENHKLDMTEYTQIAMLTVEAAILRVLEERGIRPDVTAGLSLGEYGAMVACGAVRAEEAFAIVRRRGIYMQEAVPVGGAMAAVLGLPGEVIREVCENTPGMVSIANYNCPGQIVISGKKAAVETACERLKEAGAKRTVMLNVSGPFHSRMLTGAGEKLGKVLEPVEVHTPTVPYVANVTAGYVKDAAQVKPLLVQQVSSSVRWQQSMELLLADGVDTFIEIGPGKTLAGFMKKINRTVKVLNIEKLEDVDKVVEALA